MPVASRIKRKCRPSETRSSAKTPLVNLNHFLIVHLPRPEFGGQIQRMVRFLMNCSRSKIIQLAMIEQLQNLQGTPKQLLVHTTPPENYLQSLTRPIPNITIVVRTHRIFRVQKTSRARRSPGKQIQNQTPAGARIH